MVKRKIYIDGQQSDNVASAPSGSKLFSVNASDSELAWGNVLDQQEVVTVTVDGQTAFNLSYMPLDTTAVLMFINGIKQIYNVDYVVFGNVVTYTGASPSTLLTTDTVEFWYAEDKSWTPADINDVSGWWDASDTDSLVSVPGETGISQWIEKSGAKLELLTNGNFETGSPPTGWIANSLAILTSKAGTRPGGSGTQVIDVETAIGNASGSAMQVGTLVIGKRYRITGWGKGDGANGTMRVRDWNAQLVWQGTNSTDWQYFDTVFVAQQTRILLDCQGDAGTEDHTQYDDVSVWEDRDFIQDTEAERPVYESTGLSGSPSIQFDGVADNMIADGVAADFNGDDLPCTIIGAQQRVSIVNGQRVWAFGNSANGSDFIESTEMSTPKRQYFRWSATGSVTANAIGDAILTTGKFVESFVFSGAVLSTYIDGVVDVNAASLDTNTQPLDRFTLGSFRRNGPALSFGNVRVSELCVYKRALSEAERKLVESYLIRKWNIA